MNYYYYYYKYIKVKIEILVDLDFRFLINIGNQPTIARLFCHDKQPIDSFNLKMFMVKLLHGYIKVDTQDIELFPIYK